MRETKRNAVCGNCTIKLVRIAYRRAPWFRLLREPLKLGMRALSRIHHVDPAEYDVRTPACYDCIRFYKIALKERSAVFRQLHRFVNPVFDSVIQRIVTVEERRQAREYARKATGGHLAGAEADEWMRGIKTGWR